MALALNRALADLRARGGRTVRRRNVAERIVEAAEFGDLSPDRLYRAGMAMD